jgi:hypothetical protein
MYTSDMKIVTKEQASFTELLDDREGIILDLESLHYYTLNATAVFLWKLMRYGVASDVESLSGALAAAFKINADLSELDTRAFLDELEGNGLIGYTESEVEMHNRALAATSGELPAYEPPQLQLSNSLTRVTLSGSSTVAVAALANG